MVVLGSHRPNSFARCTSHAARYVSAPVRKYSCSTRIGRAGPGGSVACLRRRAWRRGFSSAETTNSSGPKAAPSQVLAYRSSTRPAFSANCASRGKIQLRCRQGCSASALNHRHKVTPLIWATMPRARTSRCRSGIVNRAKGTSAWLGNSHASRLTSTTTLGGKAGCAPASRLFLKAGHSVFKETVAPFADDLARCIESRGDEIVAESLGGQQDNLRADDVTIR